MTTSVAICTCNGAAYIREQLDKQENYWVYEFGAPKAMWVFWTIVGITNKLKRR